MAANRSVIDGALGLMAAVAVATLGEGDIAADVTVGTVGVASSSADIVP